MREFRHFDRRHYRTTTVADGYRQWLPTYEASVEDAMDLALLDALTSVPWDGVLRAADLACGTGRTGAWLRARGIRHIDGVDLVPEMLAAAERRGVYASLRQGDVAATGLDAGTYEVVTTSLVDEHLPELGPLYRETARLLRPGGVHVLVGLHPHFIMTAGMPTHFDAPDGTPLAIETWVHLTSDHVAAALAAGLWLVEMREGMIDDAWVARKPGWAAHRHHPVSFALVWRKA